MGDGSYLKRVKEAMKKERESDKAARDPKPKLKEKKPPLPVGSGGLRRLRAIDAAVSATERGDAIARRRKAQHAPGNG
jgi:hypothetical protein